MDGIDLEIDEEALVAMGQSEAVRVHHETTTDL